MSQQPNKEELTQSDQELFAQLSALKNTITDEPVEPDTDATVESKEEAVVEEAHQENDYEAQARERGWKPKEQFIGDPDTWVDAEEFVKREPLYKALHKVNRELKRQQEANEALKKFYQGQLIKEKQQLEARRDDAIARDDASTAVETERQLNAINEQATNLSPKADLKRVFEDWVTTNDWYKTKPDMKEYADAMGMKIMAERKFDVNNMSETDAEAVFSEITTRVKKIFKDPEPVVDTTPAKPKVITKRTVSSTPQKESQPQLPTYRQLPDEAKVLYRQLVKSDKNPRGVLSHEEYMRDYVQAGGPVINGD